MAPLQHCFVDRVSGRVLPERLFADTLVTLIYSSVRERMPRLFRALTSARASSLLGALNYDMALSSRLTGNMKFMRAMGVNLDECLDPPDSFETPRKVFERKIRYWDCRPMPAESAAIVSPADARVIIGSLCETSSFFIKEKFFRFEELLGRDSWIKQFQGGNFAIFRLTPEKYHYNHSPVTGCVADCYALEGSYHSCNPAATVQIVTPYSKNKRIVTIIDTDVLGGSRVGLVAMIEVVALMIGDIVQAYSAHRYDDPQAVMPGLFMKRGQPKSLYRPGSSTDVLLFQKDRVRFAEDLTRNCLMQGVESRYSQGFGRPLVETDVAVRSAIAWSLGDPSSRQRR